MSDRIEKGVVFDHVWKKFRRGEHHDSLRDLIPSLSRKLFQRRNFDVLDKRDFWALKDVSFHVEPGQALGIIGPNGAGKSTILKLLTRILKPDRGYCAATGRVGALIEIAGGFHQDLTGRENVYFQGAIMGMKRSEIDQNFEQIIEFSGIGEFIDTPVRKYSSGMNARLGFSIAAHLNPDVILIDEILSVGDFEFQQKAFAHLESLVKRDLPMVIVSHQLAKVSGLCTHAILLERGEVIHMGRPSDCIAAYVMDEKPAQWSDESPSHVRLVGVSVSSRDFIYSGHRITLTIDGSILEGHVGGREALFVRLRATDTGHMLFQTSNTECRLELPPSGRFLLEVDLDMNVQTGVYLLETFVRDTKQWKLLARGPRTYVHVMESKSFRGIVQMNPEMRIKDHR